MTVASDPRVFSGRFRPAADGGVGPFALGLMVFLSAWSAHLAVGHFGRPPMLWPANGLVLAFLLRNPMARWPLLALSGLVGDVAAGLVFERNLALIVEIQFCNIAEAVVCAAGLRRLLGGRPDLTRMRHLTTFAAVALVAAAAASLAAGGFAALAGRAETLRRGIGWTLSDALGLIVVAPALLTVDRAAISRLLAPGRAVRNLALLGGLCVAGGLVFGHPELHLRALIVAALVLVAFETDTAGVAVGLLGVSLAATAGALAGGGADDQGQVSQLMLAQGLLIVATLTAFPVAAAIARRRELEAALAGRAREFQTLVDNTSDIILHTDTEGMILYASPSLRRLGYEPADVIGTQVWDAVHPDDQAGNRERTGDLWAGKPPRDTELRQQRVRCADGSWVWLEGNPTVLRDADGAITGIVNAFRDITSRKALEMELERKRDEAEAAVVAKTEFLANMSHEIRTPLTAIIGFAGVLEGSPDLPGPAQQHARRISVAGEALLSVVNDILDFSKMEAGQVELDPRPFDPAAFLAETVQLVEPQAAAKGLPVRARIAGELPAAVLADSVRLRQVLLNLLANAIKFTAEGEVSVEASYDPADGGRLGFVVSDTGVGIPAAHQARLFERFSQADASINRRYGGTGLGLAICRNLAELMGGTIAVESAEGQGATFRFSVLAPAADPATLAAPPAAAAAEDAPAARILVVDDVTANREVVRALLGVLGHELTEADGGQAAVDKALAEPFDLILMDIQMPGMDGLAATRAIRAGAGPNRDTPIVALSADVLELHQKACRDAGMDDHLAKPINTADLFAKVAQWAGGREAAD